jgi:hypothetical protein
LRIELPIEDCGLDLNETVPAALRARITADLRPVVPLPRPIRRMLWLVPIAVLLLGASVFVFGLRRDAPVLGLALTWVASALQMLLGLVLATAALREAVPGTTLSRQAIGLVFATALLAVVTLTWMTWMVSPTTILPGHVAFVWRVCVAGTVLSALPALAVSGFLVARAFPLRPRLAGALYGIAAGLMADAGWRLFCHFSDPRHVFGAHIFGVALAGALGVLVATVLKRR